MRFSGLRRHAIPEPRLGERAETPSATTFPVLRAGLLREIEEEEKKLNQTNWLRREKRLKDFGDS
jgi:hypothetical protein